MGDLGPDAVILVRSAGGCPQGWQASGSVALITSGDYPTSAEQVRSNPGIITSATAGSDNVNFFLCTRGAE
jgi:hypothetical protein